MTPNRSRSLLIALLITLSGLVSAVAAVAQTTGTALTIEVNGARLTATAWGTGEPIIALPGRGADVTWFGAVAPLLAASGYRVIAINPRGVAGSTGSLSDVNLASAVRDAVEAMDALSLSRVHLLGWALGNRVSRAVAVAHPERVATVTLIAAGGKFPATAPDDGRQRVIQQWTGDPALPPSLRRWLPLFSPASNAVRLLAEAGVGAWPEAQAAQGAIGAAKPDSWWSGGTKPILVVQGLDDITAPPANGRALQREYPDRVQLVEFERAGHALLLERPADVVAAVAAFLGRHRLSQ